MFKRLVVAVMAVLSVAGIASARESYAHDGNVLPKAAKTVLAQNFKAGVSVVKLDKDFGHVREYEVVLTDGTEISFDRDGNWENVEVNINKSVPSGIVPNAISSYVKQNQPKQKIVGIEKERGGYEVALSNGIEMKFDKSGQFVKYDR